MLQFLRFDKKRVAKSQFDIISGSDAFRFFSKQTLYCLLLIYSTIFLAAALSFDGAYFIGGVIAGICLIRLVDHIIKYRTFKDGRIIVDIDAVEVHYGNGGVRIPSGEITYVEKNLFSNLVIRQKHGSAVFPLSLLKEDDHAAVVSLFEDMSPKRTETLKKAWDIFDAVLVAFILAMHIRQFIIQAYFIPTGSMEDTLLVGDHLLVEKITYGPTIPKMLGMKEEVHCNAIGLRKVRRGDIIIFRPPNEEEKDFIKRCIAVEGDEYHIKDGSVWINGKRIEEPYIKGITSYRGFSDRKIEGKVPPGMVIAMGDNRENSFDSRGFGYLPVKRIKGRALVLYWNTRQIKNLDFSRFGLIR